MTTEILPVIFKIVNIRRSGQGLWKFLIFCNSPVFFRIFLIIKINTFLLVFESEIGKFHENSFDKRQYFFHFRALLDTPIPGGVKQLMMPIMFTNFWKNLIAQAICCIWDGYEKFWIFTFNFKMSKKVQMSTSYIMSGN